jgi:DNA-binding NarL/FixJ family response regulator
MICENPQPREIVAAVPIDSHAVRQVRVGQSIPTTRTPGDQSDDIVKQVVAADATALSMAALARLWQLMATGEAAIVGSFFGRSRCGLLLQRVESPTAVLSGRRRRILEEVLRGLSQNAIAIDLGLAPSTVASDARVALETLGVCGRPSRAHPLLMLAATVAWCGGESTVSSGTLEIAGTRVDVVGMDRPERAIAGLVPGAELEVIASLVEGCSYTEIATRRGTAVRTIANQIAASFRRLNVSGRSELIQRLFVLDGLIPPSSAPGSALRPAEVPPVTLLPRATLSPPTVREPLSRPTHAHQRDSPSVEGEPAG